jgi:hypothetical protein
MLFTWLTILATLGTTACGGDPQAAAAARMRAWRASDLFLDPVQRELASAVEKKDVDAIDAAIHRGANVNAPGKDGIRPLVWAMAKDSVVGFEALLRHGADLKAPAFAPRSDGERMKQVIEIATAGRNSAFLKTALAAGFDPDYVPDPKNNQSLLFLAVRTHSAEAARILMAAGADVDWQNNERTTPAGEAQLIRDYRLVCLFMDHGADLTIKDKWGGDIAAGIKEYGTRGVRPEDKPFFDKVVAELEKRGLITQQDIVEADKPKKSSRAGVRTIVHPPGSEADKALRELDKAEQEANRRDGLRKP